MFWKKIAADYFSFTRKDRIGVLSLLTVILLLLFLPEWLGGNNESPPVQIDTSWIAQLRQAEQRTFDKPVYSYNKNKPKDYSTAPVTNHTVFYFDPNTLSAEAWRQLGIRDKTITTIQNYVSKGGRFKTPEDLRKIYGLRKEVSERLIPYVKIHREEKPQESFIEKKETKQFTSRYAIIDINTADTTAFINLPGIGSKLAVRIVGFRERLGGFYSVDQIKEVYGLADSVYQKLLPYLKLETISIRTININTATLDELKSHPYIRYNLANPIIAYRNEHGPFQRMEDLRKIVAVTEEIFKRISPYLKID